MMFNLILLSIERLALALIVGGGVMMAAGVRPLLLPILASPGNSSLIGTVEGISINAWNRYNRLALFATIIVTVLNLVRIFVNSPFAIWHLCMAIVILLAVVGKLSVDKQLRTRLQDLGVTAVGSANQDAGHRRVEFLSKIILVLAVVLIVLPY